MVKRIKGLFFLTGLLVFSIVGLCFVHFNFKVDAAGSTNWIQTGTYSDWSVDDDNIVTVTSASDAVQTAFITPVSLGSGITDVFYSFQLGIKDNGNDPIWLTFSYGEVGGSQVSVNFWYQSSQWTNATVVISSYSASTVFTTSGYGSVGGGSAVGSAAIFPDGANWSNVLVGVAGLGIAVPSATGVIADSFAVRITQTANGAIMRIYHCDNGLIIQDSSSMIYSIDINSGSAHNLYNSFFGINVSQAIYKLSNVVPTLGPENCSWVHTVNAPSSTLYVPGGNLLINTIGNGNAFNASLYTTVPRSGGSANINDAVYMFNVLQTEKDDASEDEVISFSYGIGGYIVNIIWYYRQSGVGGWTNAYINTNFSDSNNYKMTIGAVTVDSDDVGITFPNMAINFASAGITPGTKYNDTYRINMRVTKKVDKDGNPVGVILNIYCKDLSDEDVSFKLLTSLDITGSDVADIANSWVGVHCYNNTMVVSPVISTTDNYTVTEVVNGVETSAANNGYYVYNYEGNAGEVVLGYTEGGSLHELGKGVLLTENITVNYIVTTASTLGGASIRYGNSVESSGIRFGVKIYDDDNYMCSEDYITGIGIAVIHGDKLNNGTEFTIDNYPTASRYATVDKEDLSWQTVDDDTIAGLYFTVSNVYSGNYTRRFVARGYLVVEYESGSKIVYMDLNNADNKTVYACAKSLIGSTSLTSSEGIILRRYLDCVVSLSSSYNLVKAYDAQSVITSVTVTEDYSEDEEDYSYKISLTVDTDGFVDETAVTDFISNGFRGLIIDDKPIGTSRWIDLQTYNSLTGEIIILVR